MKKTINGQELFFKKKTQIHFLSKSVTRVRTCVAVRRLFPSVSKTRFFSSSSSGCCDSPSLLYNSNFEKEEGKRKMSVKIVCARGHLLAVTKALGRSRLYASFVYCINGRLEEKRKEEEKGKKNSMGFFLLITSSCVCHRDASQRCGPAQDISNSTVELLWQYSHAASSTFSFSTFSVHVITIETTTKK
jgi:hypothetical protein